MKEIQFLIHDVREQTDNTDTNGIKDREIIRYFNDGVKGIQAIIFKNNPLCSYHQEPVIFSPISGSRVYDLPSDCYGDNAVSMVEIKSSGEIWQAIERVWPEDVNGQFGWFTRNQQVVISGKEDRTLDQDIRVWYFKRTPRFDKAWGTVTGVPVGQVITINNNDNEMFKVDRFITVFTAAGVVKLQNIPFTRASDTTLTAVGDITSLVAGDVILMGKISTLELRMPEEIEPYLLDYVAQRIVGRNSYTEQWEKTNYWTSEERGNIISIFADAAQAQTRAPITDTEYLEI
jgi:hypothetical protein